jgi:hypothetical protein
MTLREIKARAREDLHRQMRVLCNYRSPQGALTLGVHCRVHSKFEAKGDMQGTSFNYAESVEKTPRLVFWRDQIDEPTLVRGGVVVISADEAYRLDTVEPPDLQTVTWLVTALPSAPSGVPVP